ncbi:MAG TPA: hypothetical protein VFN23_03945 [Ktedonobacteraceae bacterium]|nr:hypothetical protein [Ktedonobacteraceae bacterium]
MKQPGSDDHSELDRLISQSLHRRADKIQIDPFFQQRIWQNLQPRFRRKKTRQRKYIAIGLATAACLLILLGIATLPRWLPVEPATLQPQIYVTGPSLKAPALLARDGQIISLDPREQHLIYTPANQPGVIYTADLSNPIASNHLAMRYARAEDWSADGSSLIATIQPEGSPLPLLALVSPIGGYMHPLAHYTSTAADWLPGSSEKISFVTQKTNKADFWETSPTGKQTALLYSLPFTEVVQQMAWSPDGKRLALLVTTKSQAGSQPSGEKLLLVSEQTGQTSEFAPSANVTLSDACWSPNGQYLSLVSQDSQRQTTLVAYNVSQKKVAFSSKLQGKLEGWGWSPDSRVLIYSDNGKLQSHTLSGRPIRFADNGQRFSFPIWLHNGQILCLATHGNTSTLLYLVPAKS